VAQVVYACLHNYTTQAGVRGGAERSSGTNPPNLIWVIPA